MGKNLFYTTCFYKSSNLEGFLFALKYLSEWDNNLDLIIFTIEPVKKIIYNLLQNLQLDDKVQLQTINLIRSQQMESLKYEIFNMIDSKNYDRFFFMSCDNYLPINNISKFIENFNFESNNYLSYHFKNDNKTIDPYKKLKIIVETDGLLIFRSSELIRGVFQNTLSKFNNNIESSPDSFLIQEISLNNTFSNKNILELIYKNENQKNYFILENNLLSLKLRDVLLAGKVESRECIYGKYSWKHDCVNQNGFIEFLPEGRLNTTWIEGVYKWCSPVLRILEATWNGVTHILKFSEDYKSFVSLRYPNYHLSSGLFISV